MALTLDGDNGISGINGSAATPAVQGTDTNTGLTFGTDTVGVVTGGSTRTTVDSSGRLLVGTSTAQGNNRLQLEGSASGAGEWSGISLRRGVATASLTSGQYLGAVSFQSQGGAEGGVVRAICDANWSASSHPTRLTFETTASSSTSPTERMQIAQEGQTRIFSDDDAFHAQSGRSAGTVYACIYGRHSATGTRSGTASFLVYTNGNVLNTNNSYGSLSDIKLKENIVAAGSQWDDLKAIQVRKYNFKAETNQQTHTQLGVIAQEVELVSPGLVTESPDRDDEGNDLGTTTKSVNYSVLYMKSVKALQEAMTRIESLETRVAQLEGGAA